MIEKLRKKTAELFKICKYGTVKTPIFLATIICGCLASFLAGQFLRWSATHPSDGGSLGMKATPSEATQMGELTATPSFLFPPAAFYSDATPANAEIMRPDYLNLACIYDERASGVQPSDSMAGQLYQKLAVMDSRWAGGIFDLYNYTPSQLAPLLGLPVESITTSYGVIEDFKNIQVHFYNGDGREVSGSSNTRSIVSMANTLYYYGALKNQEELEAYVSKLWEKSHSYKVHMGNVYYCDGSCLLEKEEKSREVGEGSEENLEESRETLRTSDETAGTSRSENGIAEEERSGASTLGGENTGVPANSNVDSSGGSADGGGPEKSTEPAETGGAAPGTVGDIAEGHFSASESAGDGSGHPDSPQASGYSGRRAAAPETSPGGGPGISDNTTSSADTKAGIATVSNAKRLKTGCPGHVDLSIHITIKGVTERANLYEADPVQPLLSVGRGGWTGWDENTKGFVDILNSQDWYELYGLNTSDLLVLNPLTSSEIESYMSLLPPDASPARKELVRYALASVGKIPYYWGGKPSAPGYSGNDFGSVVSPDEDGRFLRGLDCSGWVNWVYWSVTGRGLGAESTATLVGSGRAITKSELLPGDICIRTGTMGHVVIFLGWTDSGEMLCIQETTGNVNNVEVGAVASDWQSYRRIIN